MKPLQTTWKLLKKIFFYLEPLWVGGDGKISLRASLAIFFSWKLVENLDYGIQKWAEDRTLSGLDSNLIILAGLIAALLGITAYSNVAHRKIESDATNPSPIPDVINVQTAQNVGTTKTTAETVNAEKVETVNTQNTNISQQENIIGTQKTPEE